MDPRTRYTTRGETLSREREALQGTGRRLSAWRTAAFLGALGFWVAADVVPGGGVLRLAAAAAVLGFLLLVIRHRRLRGDLRRVEAAQAWVALGIARLDRRWDQLPSPVPLGVDPGDHPYARDLDLFGTASLASLLAPVHTAPGRARLESWLLEPSDPDEALDRQAAVSELARDWEQRERVAVEGALAAARGERETGDAGMGDFGDFLEWCRGEGTVPRWLGAAAWVLPVALAAGVAAHVAGLASPRGWVIVATIQAVLAYRWGRPLQREFVLAAKGLPELRFHHGALARWEGYEARSEALRREVGRLGAGEDASSAALARLDRLLHLANVRLSTLYPVLAVGLLWDVHVVRGLRSWRRRHGARVEGWMDAMGRLEALSAMGALAGDHPDWCLPRFQRDGSEPRLVAGGLGHPLLHPSTCVRNDVALGPPGSVLLVTGSNMSGKSTLLRSVGLAVVMAEAGMPVCARELTLPPVRLFTSMRVQDSLEAGVSYFMAELLRLKALLDAAAAPPGEGGAEERPLLYLVDEILQGTNSEERQVAGRRLIRQLLRRPALGAVTTHDLELHRDPEVEAAAELVHFRESLDDAGRGLSFDYLLRPGLATTRNALRLAERVGITDPDA